ncbi:hypothetical protein Tco_0325162 [Tanacetum coccineum]
MSEDGNSSSNLSLQLANLLKNGLNPQPQNPKLSDNLQINLKLNSKNYALWTRMIRVAIGGKSKTLSGRDKLQTFNLHVKANEIKQNDSALEEFQITLQGIWGEINRIDPNPIKCPEDIKIYSNLRTGVIIGRGTERQGLHYVDEVTGSGTVMLSHGTAEREA